MNLFFGIDIRWHLSAPFYYTKRNRNFFEKYTMFSRKFSNLLILMFTYTLLIFADCAILNAHETYESNSYCDPCELYCGGLWLGINYSSYSGDDWALMVGWYNTCFLIDLGYSYESTKVHEPRDTFHIHELRGHIGLRHRLYCSNLFITYGALGSYGFRSKTTPTRTEPHEVGIFVGLDYQLSRHFLISGKLSPYVHERSFNKNHHDRVFSEGSFTFAYVF